MSTETLETPAEVLAYIVGKLEMVGDVMERENNWLGRHVDREKDIIKDTLALMELRNACDEEKEAEAEFYSLTLRADQVEKHIQNIAKVAEFAKWASGHLQAFKVAEDEK